ncbi:MAG: metallophosphoesterase family protein [Acutalibacteraceae bacterium]
MFSRIVSIFVVIATAIMSLTVSSNTVTAPPDNSDFTPVIRFVAASDTHLVSIADKRSQKMQKVMTLAYSDAEQDESYKTVDAAVFAGDLTDNGTLSQFINFKATVDSVIKDETELLPVAAKSHDGNTLDKTSLSIFEQLTGLTSDYHKVINGFHFIGISASKTQGEHYSKYQRTWLRQQLDEAVKDDSEKPIFVIQHEHITDTVYGSTEFDGWGLDYFKDILCQYPTVVDFSGHSHYPLNDPRSVWQGEFTAIGTGALKYAEFTVDGERKVHPENNDTIAQCWIVEVDENNRLRLRGFDAQSATLLCEYVLDNLSDVSKRQCTPKQQEAAAVAPQFDEDAALTVKKCVGKYKITIPKAEGTINNPVFLYRIYVLDENGNEVSSGYVMNNSWSGNTYDSVSLNVKAKAGYTIKAAAENAYGMQSQALTAVVNR